jgi:diacylglycerol O-acyltransferase-1
MATKTDTAVVSGIDAPALNLTTANGRQKMGQSTSGNGDVQVEKERQRPQPKKYKHVAAIHCEPRTSVLSHDSEVAPSFLGFRNLMVLVLSALSLASDVVNYRLTALYSRIKLAINA